MGSVQQRIGKHGKTRFRCQVRLRGGGYLSATFRLKTQAHDWIRDTESAIEQGQYLPMAEAKRRLVGELIDRYIDDRLPQLRSADTPEQILTWWKEQLGHLRIADVNTALIKETWDCLAKERVEKKKPLAPRTLNGYLQALSSAFSYGISDLLWTKENPVRSITKKSLPKGRVRFLSDDELKRFLAQVDASTNSRFKLAAYLSLATGGRRSEVLGLTWNNVDLKTGRITFESTKNGDRRSVIISGKPLQLLHEFAKIRRLDTNQLFPHLRKPWQRPNAKRLPFEDLRAPFETALDDAKITDFRWHDMRHCAASYMLSCGATLPEIGQILGHRTAQMTLRYAHLAQSRANDVVKTMTERFLG